jgi:hypothetical protein
MSHISMAFFIFILVLMFSLSGVLYLTVLALPRIAELDATTAGTSGGDDANVGSRGAALSGSQRLLDRWANSKLPEKIDTMLNNWFLKFLRKF